MQHRHQPHPYPPPDIYPAGTHSHPQSATPQLANPQQDLRTLPAPNPNFLIVGIFVLRLARRLIQSLDDYPERAGDITWLDTFLAPYNTSYGLAKVTGSVRQAYLAAYPAIISRMKVQARYPAAFMALNPATPDCRETLTRRGGLTDAERLEIIDFSDAAREWGSTVPIPEPEAQRMMELAGQRRVADLERRLGVDVESIAKTSSTNIDYFG